MSWRLKVVADCCALSAVLYCQWLDSGSWLCPATSVRTRTDFSGKACPLVVFVRHLVLDLEGYLHIHLRTYMEIRVHVVWSAMC